MGLNLKSVDLENDAKRLARPWQVRSLDKDVLVEAFDTKEEAISDMASRNLRAKADGLPYRYRLAHKIEGQPNVKI